MKKLLYFIFTFLTVACGSNTTTDNRTNFEITEDAALSDSILNDPNGLPFWTADTIKHINMPMVLLMDSLYRFVESDEFRSNNLNSNIRWMSNYRKQLCACYNRNKMGSDTISPYAKANYIMESANRLWELDENYSTMGMIVSNNTKITRTVFTHFNEFLNLLASCDSKEKQRALKSEFEAWCNMEREISKIKANLINLMYCGGSAAGPARTAAYLKILDAHVQLYKKESNWINKDGYFETRGVYPQIAKELLIKCCQNTYAENYSKDYALNNAPYKKIATDTKQSISELSPIIDKWLDARLYWDNLNSSDWSEHLYNLNTGEVLLNLSNIICI